jgi:hypothetical protein
MGRVFPGNPRGWEENEVYPDRKIFEECIQIGRYGRSVSR